MTIRFTLEPLPDQDDGNYPQMEIPNVPEEKVKSLLQNLTKASTSHHYMEYQHTEDGSTQYFYINSSRVLAAGAHPDEKADS